MMYAADGSWAPPMIMYAYKEKIPDFIIKNTPEGWGIGTSGSGWMTTESFYEYMTNMFYRWLIKN